MMDKQRVCQNCEKRTKEKKCKVSGKYVARKKLCDIDSFNAKRKD